ncbi:MAG: hypothetical protein KIY12_06120 [Thermoplasmata archaeon]|uniref:Cobalamin-independent methionine synthase MetE C-terminal/archaeal domain-containing protein n=1 Tax=Candidatus Sysuiplasma superficiale TaxID=2823368 RepID=A0A8J7YSP8_9ARCH|nr:hypothetical protein [Candidatus Sysuiplasma superficiale]MBX8644282.1 hypothetical protein [Candidatus Sysuiplasma superficiale]
MAVKLFPAQEIGSLAKPNWRVLGYRGVPISDRDFSEARYWGKKLKIQGYEKLLELLKSEDSPEVRERIKEWSAIYAIALLESAGLDIVYDGEQWRTEMYEALVKEVGGFRFVGHVRSWDNKYYRKAAVVDRIEWKSPVYLNEFLFTKSHTSRIVKVPFTGPYTVTDWSFNEYYQRKLESTYSDPRELKRRAYNDLLFEVARNLIRPEIQALVSNGAKWIQIDEPALSTQPGKEQIVNFVQAINEAVRGFDCKFSLHVCYSTDYTALFPELLEAKSISQYALEFANRDSNKIGESRRSGYEVVKLLAEYKAGKEIGLGVVDVHDDKVESPGLVRDRILYAAKLLGDPALIYVNPDCGLRTRDWSVTYSKLVNMVRGAQQARNRSS